MTRILITGGAGFIGSHTCVTLLEAGYKIVVLDSFINSSPESLERVKIITNSSGSSSSNLEVIEGDIRDNQLLDNLFRKYKNKDKIEAVVHFAGLKAVGESVEKPLLYWDVNVNGTRCLLQSMQENKCNTIIFSSSATIYGISSSKQLTEDDPINPINPYGNTKAAIEKILSDVNTSNPKVWRIACLRYFNPVGAHPSGLIGENPFEKPNNLFPFITQVAIGKREKLNIFGNDWPSTDGTGIRDYIHVMDLADGHRDSLALLLKNPPQIMHLNLGSGNGVTVLEMVKAFEKVTGKKIPFEFVGRRPGDVFISVANPGLALQTLGWSTKFSISDICNHGWNWQQKNPNGYPIK